MTSRSVFGLLGEPPPGIFTEAELVIAHHDMFERAITEHILRPRHGWPSVPVERRRCTMAMALAAALPGKLDSAATAIGLELRKDPEGTRLMRLMATPRKPTKGEAPGIYWHDGPELREKLHRYCARDVEVTRELWRRLPPLSPTEQLVWQLDAGVNDRGFAVDLELARAAQELARHEQQRIDNEIAELTNGRITSAHQVARIRALLEERGHQVQALGKRNVSQVLARGEPDEDIRRLLELRREGGRAAAKKLDALFAGVDADSRMRGTLRYHAAAPGRWSGARFQPQNLPRLTIENTDAAIAAVLAGDVEQVRELGDVLDVIGNCMRGMIRAAPGLVFLGGDFSAIESRVLAWLAGEDWKVENYRAFDRTGDPSLEPYCVTASRLLGRKVTPEDKADRQIGKTADLALGFGGALGAWRRFCPDDARSDDEIDRNITAWRRAHPAITRFWRQLENAIRICVSTGRETRAGKIRCELKDGNLYLILPSGRRIAYPQARLGPGKFENSVQVYFQDNAKGAWTETRGWYGTFTENVVQGTARDLLAAALLRLAAAGFKPVLHVHDEAICEEFEDTDRTEEFHRLMTTLPDWAEQLPIAAETWRGVRYIKSEAEEKPEHVEELGEQVADAPELEDPIEDLFRENHAPAAEQRAPQMGAKAIFQSPPIQDTPSPEPVSDDAVRNYGGNGFDRNASQQHGDGGGASNGYLSDKPPQGGSLAIYIYYNDRNEPHLKVVRTKDKQFPQAFQVDGQWVSRKPSGWVNFPYRLPELVAAAPTEPAWICEGEKDALNIIALGLIATCNPGGACKWTTNLNQWFAGKQTAYVAEDNDAKGRAHAAKVASALHGIVPDIRIVSFPELPERGDVSDWLALGHTREELIARAEAAPKWTPPELESARAASFTMTAVEWVWPERFAIGKMGIIAGLPDEGKGQILCDITARVTHARTWPCNEGVAPLGNVILLGSEDGIKDTVVPRLAAAGADLDRVEIVQMMCDANKKRMFSLVTDLEVLRRKVVEVGDVRLVLIDPVSAYLGVGKIDSFRGTDVRAVLGPLIDLAEELKVAIVGILHFNKKTDVTNALLRVSDSSAFGAAPRHVYAAVSDPENDRKLFVKAKNNLTRSDQKALAYTFDVKEVGTDEKTGKPIWAPRIVWMPEHVDVTASEAMQAAAESKSPAARDTAKQFLKDMLSAGPVAKSEIEEAAEANGISARTLFRAKGELKIAARQDGPLKDGHRTWRWHLPA